MMELSGKAKELMEHLPPYWHDVEEMQRIFHSEGVEFELLTEEVQNILKDAYIMTASEKRISDWEKRLKLPPTGTLDDRRKTVLQYIANNSKLSGTVIKTLVASLYNNARAHVNLEDSEIKVLVVPLPENQADELDFSLLSNQLESRKPCHIGLIVERMISDWEDVRDGRLRSWNEIKTQLKSWEDVLMYIPR